MMAVEQQIGQEYLFYRRLIWGDGGVEFKTQETSPGIVDCVLNNKLPEVRFALVDISVQNLGIPLDQAYGVGSLGSE